MSTKYSGFMSKSVLVIPTNNILSKDFFKFLIEVKFYKMSVIGTK